MKFEDIPPGAAVFLDANTLIYYFAPDPVHGPACARLLQRIDNQDILGFTSAHVLSDVAHRLMTLEAHKRFTWPFSGMVRRLKRHPAEVRQLSRYRQAVDEVSLIGIQRLIVTGLHVSLAVDVTSQYGLLASDALRVVVMRDNNLTHLASNDADFDRIPGITRFAPT